MSVVSQAAFLHTLLTVLLYSRPCVGSQNPLINAPTMKRCEDSDVEICGCQVISKAEFEEMKTLYAQRLPCEAICTQTVCTQTCTKSSCSWRMGSGGEMCATVVDHFMMLFVRAAECNYDQVTQLIKCTLGDSVAYPDQQTYASITNGNCIPACGLKKKKFKCKFTWRFGDQTNILDADREFPPFQTILGGSKMAHLPADTPEVPPEVSPQHDVPAPAPEDYVPTPVPEYYVPTPAPEDYVPTPVPEYYVPAPAPGEIFVFEPAFDSPLPDTPGSPIEVPTPEPMESLTASESKPGGEEDPFDSSPGLGGSRPRGGDLPYQVGARSPSGIGPGASQGVSVTNSTDNFEIMLIVWAAIIFLIIFTVVVIILLAIRRTDDPDTRENTNQARLM